MKYIIFTITAVLLFAAAAFAQGDARGAKTSFKDTRDGQVYGIKKIGNLTWMKENLRYDFPDESWCYNDEEKACSNLGMLYTFDAAKKACPTGWRLPTDFELMTIVMVS